jgi:uncharacterized protein (DUF849 family)
VCSHGLDSYAEHVAISADQARASRSEAIAAASAGATMIHLHARDPQTGRPDQSPELFRQFLPTIKAETDATINITTGGCLGMTLDQSLASAKWPSRKSRR